MADLLTELEGFLGAEQVAKLRANPDASARLARASEVVSFYDGETEVVPAPPVRRAEAVVTPPVVRPASGNEDTLAAIMARLDSFGDIKKTVSDTVSEVVRTQGAALQGAAVSESIKITRELSKLDARHRADFGEDLDDTKLSAHIQAAVEQGRPFRTVSDAYDDMTKQARMDKLTTSAREEGKREALKERASGNLPGVTPTAATPMLSILRKSGSGAPGSAGTHLDGAARALEARLAERGEQVA